MRSPHLLRVDEDPSRFAPLIEAARALGLRVGWLELGVATGNVPDSLETAAGFGMQRAVAVGEGRSIAVKPLRGQPVLRDLLREHFQGCALVLVRGDVAAPVLTLKEEAWIVTPPGAAARSYTVGQVAAALRQPHPW